MGTIAGDYEYKPDAVGDYPHIRKVDWQGRVSRNRLTTSARNTLGFDSDAVFCAPRGVGRASGCLERKEAEAREMC